VDAAPEISFAEERSKARGIASLRWAIPSRLGTHAHATRRLAQNAASGQADHLDRSHPTITDHGEAAFPGAFAGHLTLSLTMPRLTLALSKRDGDFPSRMSVLDVADGRRNLAQRESAVNHRSHLSSFAEFLQHHQVSLVGFH
jgi:hypothetical protein